MSCETNLCGTGGWTGPKPGDPDNNSILTATPAFGGIDVSWSYPVLNPFAVAHTLLYRGLTADFNSAIQIAVVSGNFFYDKQDNVLTHYYWIRIVSVNGTEGELIGPASATARRTIEQTIEDLTGQIDRGLLAQSLKTEIDRITLTYDQLSAEIAERVAGNEALALTLAEVQTGVAESLAFINTETTRRTEGDASLLRQVNTVAALNQQNAAAILVEQSARVTADNALTSQVNLVLAATGENAAAIQRVSETQTDITSALARDITTVQSTVFGNTASGQVGLSTKVETIDGKVTQIGALYTAKVTVNGLIGGFGVYNDGTIVEAGFDVDRFWVGRTGTDKRKPFIIEGNEVFINEGVINRLTFNKLRSADGSIIVENGRIKANYLNVLEIMGGAFTGYVWPPAGQTGFYVGPKGLLLGNQRDNRFFQVTALGDVYSPAFTMVNGELSFSGTVISTDNLKPESVNIFKLARGASLPDYVRTYKGSTIAVIPVNEWLPLELDPAALNNKIGAKDIDAYRILLPAGTYFYELSVPVKCSNSDTNDGCYTAIVENSTKRVAGAPYKVLSKAGANKLGDWQTSTIVGVGRFTVGAETMISVAVTTVDSNPTMRVIVPDASTLTDDGPESGYSKTIIRIWRDSNV
jgi:hypothetical protein